MAEHTKLPWKVFRATNGFLLGIGDENGEGITDSGFGLWRGESDEAQANAELIVRAVNMHESYEALADDVEAFISDYQHGLGPDISRLVAVLAKVRGVTP